MILAIIALCLFLLRIYSSYLPYQQDEDIQANEIDTGTEKQHKAEEYNFGFKKYLPLTALIIPLILMLLNYSAQAALIALFISPYFIWYFPEGLPMLLPFIALAESGGTATQLPLHAALFELSVGLLAALSIKAENWKRWDVIAMAAAASGGSALVGGVLMIVTTTAARYFDESSESAELTLIAPGALFISLYLVVNGVVSSGNLTQGSIISLILAASAGAAVTKISTVAGAITLKRIIWVLMSGLGIHAFASCMTAIESYSGSVTMMEITFPDAIHATGLGSSLSPTFAFALWVVIALLVEIYLAARQKPDPPEGALADQQILGKFSP